MVKEIQLKKKLNNIKYKIGAQRPLRCCAPIFCFSLAYHAVKILEW